MNALPALRADERKQLFWFLMLAFYVLAAGYGLREPWPSDEPRFVLVAKQMVDSGNYLFPHRGIQLYPDKPSLTLHSNGTSHTAMAIRKKTRPLDQRKMFLLACFI